MCCSLLSVGVLAEGEAVESCTEHEDCAGHAELADESAPVSVLAVEELISAVAESVEEASAEESAETLQYGCEVHTPGELWWEADYTECGGGWTVDRYWCEDCGDACDTDGNALNRDEMYREGTGKHTPGEMLEADYTECGGGWTVERYLCDECGLECDIEGNDLDWDEIYEVGTGKHTPGEMIESDYTECGGGWIVDSYWCEDCGMECDAEGNELSWKDDYKEGTGQPTPGKMAESDYTECSGG